MAPVGKDNCISGLNTTMLFCVILGYNENQIEKFTDDLNSSLALLADWIITSGNTTLSVDMLIGFLEKLDREDVVEIIQTAKGTKQNSEKFNANIFFTK